MPSGELCAAIILAQFLAVTNDSKTHALADFLFGGDMVTVPCVGASQVPEYVLKHFATELRRFEGLPF